jgi:hypothetical protein
VNTAAIRIAYRRSGSPVICRPPASMSGPGAADPAAASAINPPAKAAATNSMATKSRPLLRNTHGREEPVLALPYPVSRDPDEPQEGDAGEGHQVQRDDNGAAAGRICQPRAARGYEARCS